MDNFYNYFKGKDRGYRVKKSKSQFDFYCPLCRAERSLVYSAKTTVKNYIQIFCTATVLFILLYPLMKYRACFIYFITWGGFEFCKKILFRKDVPCPHCGFDATWYKRDVRMARKLVKDFWESKNNTETANLSATISEVDQENIKNL